MEKDCGLHSSENQSPERRNSNRVVHSLKRPLVSSSPTANTSTSKRTNRLPQETESEDSESIRKQQVVNQFRRRRGRQLSWHSDINSSESSDENIFNEIRRKRANRISPIPKEYHRKRVKRPWTQEEEDNLSEGVRLFGIGNWARILSEFKFEARSNVDLKDKWRNMSKYLNVESNDS